MVTHYNTRLYRFGVSTLTMGVLTSDYHMTKRILHGDWLRVGQSQ